MMRVSVVGLIAAALAFVCLVPGQAYASSLHPGDKVNVLVYNHPELSGDHTIDSAGNITVPVAGTIPALNVEPAELAHRVEVRLVAYVRYPAVAVQLTSQNPVVFIAGGPNNVVAYAPGMTISSLVDTLDSRNSMPQADATSTQITAQRSVAQGPVDLENGPIDFHQVRILRDGATMGPYDMIALRVRGETGPLLQPNDTVSLLEKPIAVHVTGAIERPGTAYLSADEPLSEALNQVGGLSVSSRENGITLVRDGVTSIVSVGGAEFGQPAENGDRLMVPRAPRVDVVGNVQKPGSTLLRGNATLVGAIYYAGGPSKYANLKAVTVVHAGVRKQYDLANVQKGGTGDNPELADGDLIQVPQGSTFEWSDVWGGLGALGLFGLRL